MRSKIGLIVAAFILVTLWSGLSASASGYGKGVSAVVKHITKSVPPPKTANKDAIAAEIDISFPEFSFSTGQNPAVLAINKAIQSRLLTLLDDKTPTTVEQLTETFIKGYERSLKEEPDMPGAWSLKFEASIRQADEDLLSIEILDSVFTGGAHPTSNIAYLVLSMKTGKPLDLSSLVPAERMNELTNVAEIHFRRIRKLKPDETYEQAGFQFEKNRFALNRNFLVSKAGLAFCFNQYEIAPYSMGVTELVIPWTDIKTVVNPNGPAGRFLSSGGKL